MSASPRLLSVCRAEALIQKGISLTPSLMTFWCEPSYGMCFGSTHLFKYSLNLPPCMYSCIYYGVLHFELC